MFRTLVRVALLPVMALAVSTAAYSQNAASWTPEYRDGVLQPLPDGFPNEEIVIVVPDDPTSSEGILATKLVEVAKQYSPVPVRTEIRQDFQAFPTWEALAYMKEEERGRAGYLVQTFGHTGSLADTLAADVKSIVGVTRDDMTPVIGLEDIRWYLSQCADVAWEPTIDALIAQIKADPGKVRYMAQGAGGGVDLAFFSAMKHFGISAEQIDAIPIGGVVEQAAATAACEGDITMTSIEAILPHVQKERVDLLMVNGVERLPAYPDLPTAADLGMANGGVMTGKELIAVSDVPDLHLAWLHELFRKVASDQSYVDARQSLSGVQVHVRSRQETQELFDDIVDMIRVVLGDLGLLVEKN